MVKGDKGGGGWERSGGEDRNMHGLMFHDLQGYYYHKCMLWWSHYVTLYNSLASFSNKCNNRIVVHRQNGSGYYCECRQHAMLERTTYCRMDVCKSQS